MNIVRWLRAVWACCALLMPFAAISAEASVAVAANFAAPMKRLAQDFERATGHRLRLSFGATGQFYAQIRSGAPFAVLLAADDLTPLRLENEGGAVRDTRFTYATGRLILWSPTPGRVDEQGEILRRGDFDRLAIANPKLAPYGAAAIAVLESFGLTARLKPRMVEAAHIGQTFQFVSSGNADLGFIALSQVYSDGAIRSGSGWIVPAALHAPIRQDAVLLNAGRDNPAARALLNYLRGESAAKVIRSFGYER